MEDRDKNIKLPVWPGLGNHAAHKHSRLAARVGGFRCAGVTILRDVDSRFGSNLTKALPVAGN